MVEEADVLVIRRGKGKAIPELKELFRRMFEESGIDVYQLIITFAKRTGNG